MAKMLNLRPVNGARVLDPDAVPVPQALPIAGKMVEDKPFWRRRLKAREVELSTDAMPTTEQDKPAGQGENTGSAPASQGRNT